MKGNVTININSKEALALISSEATPKSVSKKVVESLRAGNVGPIGARASAIARRKKKNTGTETTENAVNA